MNAIEFSQRLVQSEPGSPEAAALARDLVEYARHPAKFVLQRYLSSPGEDDRAKAKNVLAELREFALVPLAESEFDQNLDTKLWVMRTITQELEALRSSAASVLKDLMANSRAASQAPEGSMPSQLPPDARVCDLAFILLRRILHLESDSPAFFGAPPRERDKRIKDFQESRDFRAAFESDHE